MKPLNLIRGAAILSLLFFMGSGAAAPPGEPSRPPVTPPEGWASGGGPRVFAFYNPGFQNPTVSGKWNLWRIVLSEEQLTLVQNDPVKAQQWEQLLSNVDYRRAWGIFLPTEEDYTVLTRAGLPAIRSVDHPSIGLYDSFDPLLIRTHLRWAQQSGLAGFVVDWEGPGSLSDRAYALLDKAAAEMRSPLFLTVRYNSISDGRKETAESDLLGFLDTYGTGLNTLRRGIRPVIFVGRHAMDQLNSSEWTEVIGHVSNKFPSLVFGDRDANGPFSDAFDGFYNGDPGLHGKTADGIHDLYMDLINRRETEHTMACLTVIPGRDDSALTYPPVVLGRSGGALFRQLFRDALDQHPDCVLLDSFNDWPAGTEIEPSVEYGRQFLDLITTFTRPAPPSG